MIPYISGSWPLKWYADREADRVVVGKLEMEHINRVRLTE